MKNSEYIGLGKTGKGYIASSRGKNVKGSFMMDWMYWPGKLPYCKSAGKPVRTSGAPVGLMGFTFRSYRFTVDLLLSGLGPLRARGPSRTYI